MFMQLRYSQGMVYKHTHAHTLKNKESRQVWEKQFAWEKNEHEKLQAL